jgi:hypothetical protein
LPLEGVEFGEKKFSHGVSLALVQFHAWEGRLAAHAAEGQQKTTAGSFPGEIEILPWRLAGACFVEKQYEII